MGSREGESTSGSSTDSIDRDVLGRHASRSLSSQPEGNIETVIISSDSSQPEGNLETVCISSDSEPSGISETKNRTETTKDPLWGNVSPLMFESQYTESSNVGTQSEDPNNCRQIFATESVTQNYFVLVNPENADESTENADESNENADESNENADDSTDTVIFETSDSTTNTDLVSTTESESSDNTKNTQSLTQYVRGVETQDDSQEMYPATLSQSSEGLKRSDRRTEQI